MKIDGNKKEKAALAAYDQGDRVLAARLEEEFTEELRLAIANGEDYCSCTSSCEKHGNCVECVAAHRGHQGHLPACFREMGGTVTSPWASSHRSVFSSIRRVSSDRIRLGSRPP